jgi:DNA topoisomerase-1
MTYTLLIVESPAKCGSIESFLGQGYKVIGSCGHITHLSSLEQINIGANYKPNFKIIESKQPQIAKIKKAISGAQEVILATDDDREGEAIAWHIAQVFNLDVTKTKRIIFHEITENAIKVALANPRTINMNIVYAQQGRQILDLLVGFTITPLLWKSIAANSKNSLSAGRCQSPALRLVYDNYKAIKESPGTLSFNSVGYFTDKNIEFVLNKNHNSHTSINEFLELSTTHHHILSKSSTKTLIQSPPSPFSTSTLQQAASNSLHISPKETMSYAQKLYEDGLITYMRTPSKSYCEDFIEQCKAFISVKYGAYYVANYDDLKALTCCTATSSTSGNEEAHEAIRPTNIALETLDSAHYSAKHIKLYKLIYTNSLESVMSNACYNQLNVSISAPHDSHYKYSALENTFLGWKIVNNNKNEEKHYHYLKNIKEGTIGYKKIICKETLKDLKSHYSEAHLVQLLEQKGIGRPSTFSSLLEKIQERNYVKKEHVQGKKINSTDYTLIEDTITKETSTKEFGNEKNKLVITQLGIITIEFLITHFNKLFDYEYTKLMEDDLDMIALGAKAYYELASECTSLMNTLIESINTNNNNSTKSSDSTKSNETINKLQIALDDKHTYIIGKNGPTLKYTKEDGTLGFYGVKKNIDIDLLKAGHYTLEDVLETTQESIKNLGLYKEHNVYLKYGSYGYYLECGELRKSLVSVKINVPFKELTLEDAITILETCDPVSNSLMRHISTSLSIRKGKYGDYIFYKSEKMKKPQFLKLEGFNTKSDTNYLTCSLDALKLWIKEKYGV